MSSSTSTTSLFIHVFSHRGDVKALRKYTTNPYKDVLLKRVQARDKNSRHLWQLHNANAPPQILSIRSFVGHMGAQDPLQGNRLVIQALVKFDTNQVRKFSFTHHRILITPSESTSLQQPRQAHWRKRPAQACR